VNPHRLVPRQQQGAALAVALFFLVIMTLLGLIAMQAGRVDLRLSLNEESRIDALQSAQTSLDTVLDVESNLAILPNAGQLQSCFVGSALNAATLQSAQQFTCDTSTSSNTLVADSYFRQYTYVAVRRERIGDADLAPPSALRQGDSGDRYRLAAFSITAGYDRTGERQGAAEIQQGLYRRISVVDGVTLQ
jgi:Tfp pilus assembly protein PilX